MTGPDLAAFVTGFFVRYLAAERNVSPHTTAAYRDTLKLLLRFLRDVAHRTVRPRSAPTPRCCDFCARSHIERSMHSTSKT